MEAAVLQVVGTPPSKQWEAELCQSVTDLAPPHTVTPSPRDAVMEELTEINNIAGLFQTIVKDCKVMDIFY